MGLLALHDLWRRGAARAYAMAARSDLAYVGRGATIDPSSRIIGTRNVHLGARSNVRELTRLHTGGDGVIRIGEETWIGPGVVLSSRARLEIGDGVIIAGYCHVLTQGHTFDKPGRVRGQGARRIADVRLGDGCWIGAGVVINSGVTIGEGAVIGANSVVSSDVPARHIAAGSPARIVRPIDAD